MKILHALPVIYSFGQLPVQLYDRGPYSCTGYRYRGTEL